MLPTVAAAMLICVVTLAGMLPLAVPRMNAVSIAITQLIVRASARLIAVHGSLGISTSVLPPTRLVPGTHAPAVHADSQTVAVTTSTSLRG